MSTSKKWYRNEYLTSSHWKEMRKKVYQKYGYTCSIVGCRIKRLNIHHVSYQYLGTEREIEDLRPVCRLHHLFCHYRILKWEKVPLDRSNLTRRYYEIRRFTWRFLRPSDILNL